MPEQEEILFRLSLFQRVFAGCRQSLLGDGEMSCHDSRAPSLQPVRHYPHLLDIDPKPRIEWDFNPPEMCAARHTVRAAKIEELKKNSKVPIISFRNCVP
jgi:hypothetical protein